ncbi:MAG: D-glycero-beta-D-manno-heptose 1-phosphate adenylyltransferase [Gemmatimonadetes bacterium]|nr:D-glycero-beta-D-manno-heptose 1-phosphate adenylyltransferase [Gemmatimonadota bacterium]MDA1103244.1 D-glycero-beta-D-manno-heptose 1-phosphate adenylyltransferase [Gemmatimonadota bacterium]
MTGPPSKKIHNADGIVERYGRPRTTTVVFTNGVFDILHAGHISCLTAARSLGDALVVGVNSDASARRLGKGLGRPINGEGDRAFLLAALEAVDAVCIFEEDTPATLVAALLPDVLVKGGDYDRKDIVGREAVEAAGGRVEVVPYVEGYSTTYFVERIRESMA